MLTNIKYLWRISFGFLLVFVCYYANLQFNILSGTWDLITSFTSKLSWEDIKPYAIYGTVIALDVITLLYGIFVVFTSYYEEAKNLNIDDVKSISAVHKGIGQVNSVDNSIKQPFLELFDPNNGDLYSIYTTSILSRIHTPKNKKKKVLVYLRNIENIMQYLNETKSDFKMAELDAIGKLTNSEKKAYKIFLKMGKPYHMKRMREIDTTMNKLSYSIDKIFADKHKHDSKILLETVGE